MTDDLNCKGYQKTKSFFSLICYFLVFFVLMSCGKKGEPTLKSYEKPDPPSDLRAIHRESEIILLWNSPEDKEETIKGFPLMKSTGKGFERITFLEKDKRFYRDGNVETGIKYIYKVASQNLRDVMSDDSNIVEIEPRSVPPPPRKPLFAISYDTLILTWEDVGEGVFYNIYKRNKENVYPLLPTNREPIKEASFRDTFEVKKIFYYTIRSLRGGDTWDEGPPSEELEINPSEFVPSPPEGLQAVVSEEAIYILWKESPETWVTGYRVYREIDKKDGFIFLGETLTPAFPDRENPRMKRSYRITAIGPSKEGPPAEIRDVVFIPYR